MKEKIMRVIRTVEIALLKFFVGVYKILKRFGAWVKRVVGPKWHSISKTVVLAVVALYVIGGVIFGIRLYKQDRFEKADLYASYFFPFPVANSGRAIVFDHQLQLWVNSSKNFAVKNNMDVPADLGKSIVKELNDYSMVAQEADKMGMKITTKEINEKFDLTIEGIGTKEQAADFLKQMYGLSMGQFKRLITPMILVEKFKEQEFVQVKVRHILIADEGKAKEIDQKAKNGDKFEDLAKQYSEDQSSKDNGGLLAEGQFLSRDSGLVPEFEAAMFKLKPGEISDPVKTQYGYHIIKVDERKGVIDQSYTEWLESLKKKYPQRSWL